MLINDVEWVTTNYSIRWTDLIVHEFIQKQAHIKHFKKQ